MKVSISFIAHGNIKWYSYFGMQLYSSYTTKHTFTIWSSNHPPWYLPKLEACPHKYLHMNVYSSFIHNCHSPTKRINILNVWMFSYQLVQVWVQQKDQGLNREVQYWNKSLMKQQSPHHFKEPRQTKILNGNWTQVV
jgi:hypothetical protein